MSNDFEGIELADAIETIRQQLAEAAARAAGQSIQFEVGPVRLEFAVALRRDARASTGVRAWVFSADLEGGAAHTRVHRLSVTLNPKAADTGRSPLIGNPGLVADDGLEFDIVD